MVIFRMRRPIQAARRYGSPVRTVRTVVVEPARAACLHASAEAGHAVTIPHCGPMAMLECATPSPLAWEVLHHLADGFVTLRKTRRRQRCVRPAGDTRRAFKES
jgi:diaminopropionate ammonia-lyase